MISVTPAGGIAKSPVPLGGAAAGNPEIAGIMTAAVGAISSVVQKGLGGLSAASAADLDSQVLAVACVAAPNQAGAFTSQVVAAITSLDSTTGRKSAPTVDAVAEVVAAAIPGAPHQAAAIAGAAAVAAPKYADVVAAAASPCPAGFLGRRNAVSGCGNGSIRRDRAACG